jgi:hypothetical protein
VFLLAEYTRDSPAPQFQEDLDKFKAFKDLVDSCTAPNGRPRYMEKGYQSTVEVIPYAKYRKLSVSEVQTILRLRHIVITDVPTDLDDMPVQFDEAGLQELMNLDSKVHIQGESHGLSETLVFLICWHTDQSVPVRNGDLSAQLRVGTLQHILDMARDPKGAILNGLSFPLPLSAIKRDKISSDVEAWRLTEGLTFCNGKALYPTGCMRWGLASIAGSRHWAHVDCSGLATVLAVICGIKYWILFKPDLDNETDAGAHVDLFLNDFDPAVAVKTWDAEAVLLTPGTRL